jgi:hypothetical protein
MEKSTNICVVFFLVFFIELYFSVFELNDQFTLDFDRVPLGEKSRLELIITNLTDIESGIKAKIAKFKTRVRELRSRHTEIIDLCFCIGFISCYWTE